jgi:hypothetical protein
VLPTLVAGGRGDHLRADARAGPREPVRVQRGGAARQRRVHAAGRGGGGDAVGAPLHAAAAPVPGHRRLGEGVALHLQHGGGGGRVHRVAQGGAVYKFANPVDLTHSLKAPGDPTFASIK